MSVVAEVRRRGLRPIPVSLLAIALLMRMLVAAWRRDRRDRRQLAAMSDRELQDIGVCRGEVASKTGRSFWQEINGRV